ncbi:MAG: hypothetical protein ACHQCF_01955 [Solirubrobacterales bacterium]
MSERAGNRGVLLMLFAIAASLVLVVAYVAAGGASYEPEKTQNPCQHRAWSNPEGLQQILQQFTLSALDGAACKLGVSRETLARALATQSSRERFARQYGINDAELARAIRAGLLRAVSDAEEAGTLIGPLGFAARSAIRSIPLEEAIELVHNAGAIFRGGGSIVGLGEEGLKLLEGFIP